MSSTGNREAGGRTLSTADLAAAGRRPPENADRDDELGSTEADRRADDERSSAPRTAGAVSDSSGATRTGRDVAMGERSSATAGADKPSSGAEQLEPLFPADVAANYRSRWAAVQSGFVDDPRSAVRQGDELVAQMMKNLAESFAAERGRLETQLGQTGSTTTETLRVSLRRYRSFFERLLSL